MAPGLNVNGIPTEGKPTTKIQTVIGHGVNMTRLVEKPTEKVQLGIGVGVNMTPAGNVIYYENSFGYWKRLEYDDINGKFYYLDSNGEKYDVL